VAIISTKRASSRPRPAVAACPKQPQVHRPLRKPEQGLYERLAVFAGAFDLAGEAVATGADLYAVEVDRLLGGLYAARVLPYLDTTGDFATMTRSNLIAEPVRRIDADPSAAAHLDADPDARAALNHMRDVLNPLESVSVAAESVERGASNRAVGRHLEAGSRQPFGSRPPDARHSSRVSYAVKLVVRS